MRGPVLFVIHKPKLQRIISLVREDRRAKDQAGGGHYLRLEASEDQLRVSGPMVEATIPATVYEEGVLFLRVTRFRRLLAIMVGLKMLAIQVNHDGLFVEGARIPLAANDMLLYTDPAKAPENCPLEEPPGERQGNTWSDWLWPP